jgi:N-carbamoyl-L-amino-acid hydrolase
VPNRSLVKLIVKFDRLLDDLKSLSRIGAQGSGGITRRSFSPAYAEAVYWLLDRMSKAGLAARVDSVGNVIGRLGPERGCAVVSGSHIDTVPDGGWLDGAYGVLAALECARALQEADFELARAFEVVAFVDEEGAYSSLLGSRAWVGTLTMAEIKAARDEFGVPLEHAMQALGLDAHRYREARRTPENTAAYIELHIEQGSVLEQKGTDIGIVEGIVGILVSEYEFVGSADHAGTTPMNMRHDALRCAAEFITAAYANFSERKPGDPRFTFGAVEALPGVSNVVPRSARLIQEIRSLSRESIEALFASSEDLAREISQREGIELKIRRLSYNAPSPLSERVMGAIEQSCSQLGVSSMRMPSGAGHDAQSLAPHCEAGMIFVPSRRGASHRPDEATAETALEIGANVLLGTIRRFVQ